jgi:hypothetical protein
MIVHKFSSGQEMLPSLPPSFAGETKVTAKAAETTWSTTTLPNYYTSDRQQRGPRLETLTSGENSSASDRRRLPPPPPQTTLIIGGSPFHIISDDAAGIESTLYETVDGDYCEIPSYCHYEQKLYNDGNQTLATLPPLGLYHDMSGTHRQQYECANNNNNHFMTAAVQLRGPSQRRQQRPISTHAQFQQGHDNSVANPEYDQTVLYRRHSVIPPAVSKYSDLHIFGDQQLGYRERYLHFELAEARKSRAHRPLISQISTGSNQPVIDQNHDSTENNPITSL